MSERSSSEASAYACESHNKAQVGARIMLTLAHIQCGEKPETRISSTLTHGIRQARRRLGLIRRWLVFHLPCFRLKIPQVPPSSMCCGEEGSSALSGRTLRLLTISPLEREKPRKRPGTIETKSCQNSSTANSVCR
ncbi:unnamed protein product, partial [Mycena citricolor]